MKKDKYDGMSSEVLRTALRSRDDALTAVAAEKRRMAGKPGTVQGLVKARLAAEDASRVLADNEELWDRRVKEIEQCNFAAQVLGKAASIAWWDFFSSRMASEAWSDLNAWKALYRVDREVDDVPVQECLCAMGYTAQRARKRVKDAQ